MANRLHTNSKDLDWIRGQTVAVLGYGNQGRAQALNLRDRGIKVLIGARPNGKSWSHAVADGFAPISIAEASAQSGVVMMTLPDVTMAGIFDAEIGPHLQEGSLLLVCHGFSVHFGFLQPPNHVDVGLVGPKGPGAGLRRKFQEGRSLPSLVAVHQDVSGEAWGRTISYAWGIGCADVLMLETTFREECETDLFGEQAVLCGGLPQLIQAGFETLVASGYDPDLAYFECLHEVQLITDLLVQRGMAGMREAISDTARWGGLEAGPEIIGEPARQAMQRTLARIRSGEFARNWVAEDAAGRPRLSRWQAEEAGTLLESVGSELRKSLGSRNPGAETGTTS
ncbi:MAG TPA: ketol-acid reductoisomerase [Fimbriimonadaceae bacterium]|nr:ketol-acid reductoisomerase [Fimbriimonadaceae bacterium]HRJ34195.1 ketol-acid reductoisomerase [Fimbriimonadaceae bacterium]